MYGIFRFHVILCCAIIKDNLRWNALSRTLRCVGYLAHSTSPLGRSAAEGVDNTRKRKLGAEPEGGVEGKDGGWKLGTGTWRVSQAECRD